MFFRNRNRRSSIDSCPLRSGKMRSRALFQALVAGALLFSAAAGPAATIVVDAGSDENVCSGFLTLRCAINYANANPGTSIRFAPVLPAVLLQSALPTITGNFTWIDGHDINGGFVGPRIDGSAATSWTGNNGLTINASYVTISNIKVVNIPAGADISVIGGIDTAIGYDYLGILPNATQCGGPSQSTAGIDVVNDLAGSAGNDHGVAYIYANTISCHGGSGVEVVNSNYVYVGADRQGTPLGNYIGTTSDGTRAAGNGYAGVRVAVNSDQVTVSNNRIAYNANGGTIMDGTNNTVTFNTLSANYWGLAISGGSTPLIVGNKIGTSADGLLPLPNTHEGILISGGSGHFLSDNLVAYNGLAGIAVTGNSTHALIQNNEIRNNGGLPIDLGDDGFTPNGSRLPPGPNNWLPYPIMTAYSGNLVLGTACPNCNVYIYRAIGNPATPGGGGIFQTNVFANASGQWSASLPNGLTGPDITLTAGDSGGNSSEMSPRPPTPTPTPTPAATPTPTPTPTPRPATLGNISTRLSVGTSDRVMIAGFIVQGSAPKRVLIRAAGPSLTQFGVPNALANPRLELHDSTNTIGMNDDWQTTQIGGVITSDQVAEIQNSGLAPRDPLESAVIATLAPGSYTAIVQGVNGGTGVGIVEVYDLDAASGSLLVNISTRGFVQTGDNAMIGGFIVVTQATRVIIRAIGPSLIPFGVPDALANPQLELHDASSLIGQNDDWQTTQLGGIITSDQVGEIQNSQLAPTNPAESAIIATLPPGSYTAIVRGVNNTTGNALVEVYSLQ
jgi:parallel beta helix pectate lyase-like protein